MFKFLVAFLVLVPTICWASSMKDIGKRGKIEDVTRVITVKMFDNYYEPAEIKVKKGETVKFIVKNIQVHIFRSFGSYLSSLTNKLSILLKF